LTVGEARMGAGVRACVGVVAPAPSVLTMPVIADADRNGLREIVAEFAPGAGGGARSYHRARRGGWRTFTVSNLGTDGVIAFDPIVNVPEGAIQGVGAIVGRPVVADREFRSPHVMDATRVWGHRLLCAAAGAGLLARIRALFEAPTGLVL
jgi:pyruvate dehydrogenase E2 component (dihydrolipoamide acetyltransferase)